MRVTFLGTSAGEGYPGFFCNCEYCSYARRHGGKNIRGNSSVLIDDDLLIDLNAHSYEMFVKLNFFPGNVRHLLVTHPHIDHFDAQKLTQRGVWTDLSLPTERLHKTMSPCMTELPLMTVHGNEYVRKAMEAVPGLMEHLDGCKLAYAPIESGREETWEDFTFIPVASHHGPCAGFAHNYILKRGGKTLLYASDTGGYDDDMWEIIRSHTYDCVIMEGTFGLGAEVDMHMCLEKNKKALAFFRDNHLFRDDKVNFHLTHICPHWAPPHDQYEPMVKAEGMELSYDGKVIEF